MTRIMLHLQTIPKPDDTADALAMAVAHCHCSRSRLMGTAPKIRAAGQITRRTAT